MAQKIIRGYTVSYEPDAARGVEHLAYVLSMEEADSLFRSARLAGKVKFEDRLGQNYTLIGNINGTFELKKRSAWW